MAETPSDRVYITSLPKDADAAKLKEVLGAYGTIKDTKVTSPGTAIVTFASVDEAKWVVDNLDGNMPEGIKEPIKVSFAWAQRGGWGGDKGGGWKGERSSPYGGKGGGKGGDSFGKGGSIQMLKNSLMNMGVLPGGKSSKGRSDAQQLYVKGLPPDTTDADLHDIFGPFGAIPPKGIKATLTPEGQCTGVGWVDFVEEADAAKAAEALNWTMLADGSTLRVHVKNSTKGWGKGKNNN